MQKTQALQALDLARKNPRIQIAIPQEVLDRLTELAEQDGRAAGNLGAMLIQASLELIDEQGFSLVQGKLRKVAVLPDEEEYPY